MAAQLTHFPQGYPCVLVPWHGTINPTTTTTTTTTTYYYYYILQYNFYLLPIRSEKRRWRSEYDGVSYEEGPQRRQVSGVLVLVAYEIAGGCEEDRPRHHGCVPYEVDEHEGGQYQ